MSAILGMGAVNGTISGVLGGSACYVAETTGGNASGTGVTATCFTLEDVTAPQKPFPVLVDEVLQIWKI